MTKGKIKKNQESEEVIQQPNDSDNIDESSQEIENKHEDKTITITEIKETYNVPEILIKSLFKFENNINDKEIKELNENNSNNKITNNSNNLVNDKKFILNLETEILEFLKNSTIDSWKLVPLNSYYRLLTHKLSEYYNLGHILSNDGYSMVLFKINTSLINADSEIKKLASFDKNGNIKPLNYRNLKLNLNEKLNKYKLIELVKELELKYPSIKIEDNISDNNSEKSDDNTNNNSEIGSNTDTIIGMSDLSKKQFPKLKKQNKTTNINKEKLQAREELYLKINQKIKNTKTIISNNNNNDNNANTQNSFDLSYEENPQYSKYKNYNKKFNNKNKNNKLNNYNTNLQFNSYYPGYGDPGEYMMSYPYYYYPQHILPDVPQSYQYQDQLPMEEGQNLQSDLISDEVNGEVNDKDDHDEKDSADNESDDIKDTERTNDDNPESNSTTNSYYQNIENTPMFQPMMNGGGGYYSPPHPQQQHQFPGGLYPGPPITQAQLQSHIPQMVHPQQPGSHPAANGYPQMMMFSPGPMTQSIPGTGMDGVSPVQFPENNQQYQYYSNDNTYNPKPRNSVNYNRIPKKNSPTDSPLELQQGSPSQNSYFQSSQQSSNVTIVPSTMKGRKNLSNDQQYNSYNFNSSSNKSRINQRKYNGNFEGAVEVGQNLGDTNMHAPPNMNMPMNTPVNMNINMGMPMNMPMNMNSRMVPYPYQMPMPMPVPTPHLPHPDLLHKPQYHSTDPANNNNDQNTSAGPQSVPSSPLSSGNNNFTKLSRRLSTHKRESAFGTDNGNNENRNNQGNNFTRRGSSRINSVSNPNIKFVPGSSGSGSTQTKSPIQHSASVSSSAPSSAPSAFSSTPSSSSSSTSFNKGKTISSTSKNYSYLPEEYLSKKFDGSGVELNKPKSVNKYQNTKHNKSVLEDLTKKLDKVTI
ncbi:hypothetical protein B5S32_g3026 [[Candida] boidinii]|nr:hypothetical protein B5S32_g3026 [[Candida] boidinii]